MRKSEGHLELRKFKNWKSRMAGNLDEGRDLSFEGGNKLHKWPGGQEMTGEYRE